MAAIKATSTNRKTGKKTTRIVHSKPITEREFKGTGSLNKAPTPRITSGAVQGAVTGGVGHAKKLKKSTSTIKKASSGKLTKLPYKGGSTISKLPLRDFDSTPTKLRNTRK